MLNLKKLLVLLTAAAAVSGAGVYAATPDKAAERDATGPAAVAVNPEKAKGKARELAEEDDTPFSYRKCMKRCMKTQNDHEKCDFICDANNGEMMFKKK